MSDLHVDGHENLVVSIFNASDTTSAEEEKDALIATLRDVRREADTANLEHFDEFIEELRKTRTVTYEILGHKLFTQYGENLLPDYLSLPLENYMRIVDLTELPRTILCYNIEVEQHMRHGSCEVFDRGTGKDYMVKIQERNGENMYSELSSCDGVENCWRYSVTFLDGSACNITKFDHIPRSMKYEQNYPIFKRNLERFNDVFPMTLFDGTLSPNYQVSAFVGEYRQETKFYIIKLFLIQCFYMNRFQLYFNNPINARNVLLDEAGNLVYNNLELTSCRDNHQKYLHASLVILAKQLDLTKDQINTLTNNLDFYGTSVDILDVEIFTGRGDGSLRASGLSSPQLTIVVLVNEIVIFKNGGITRSPYPNRNSISQWKFKVGSTDLKAVVVPDSESFMPSNDDLLFKEKSVNHTIYYVLNA